MLRNRLLIVEPDPGTNLILKRSLSETYEIVGIVNDGYAAVDAAFNLQPDLVLIDIDLARLDGITATKWLKQGDKNIKVVVFTSSTQPEEFIEIMKAGADGYCIKGVSLEQLKKALAVVASGDTYLASGLKDLIWGSPSKQDLNKSDPLSAKEKEVLKWVVDGKTYYEIASFLGVGKETLRSHIINIKNKLKLENSRQMAMTVEQKS